jgi:hypothetical protein
MLRKLLAGAKIEMEGFGEGRARGYKFRGELAIGKLVSGAASNTSDCGGPNGDLAVGRVPCPIRRHSHGCLKAVLAQADT